ncbi:MAG: NUDIX domain-containing protein [Planctomycetaceae bacterium]|jgi:isopentenyl-diphosphate delta-isomerase type 1
MSWTETEELFDVVNSSDQVTGQAPRPIVHARNLLHRAASIFVFNTSGQLLLQFRSAAKDQYPSCWTASASGHLDAGEDYETAARRELQEELGLTSPLEFLTKFPAGPETAYEFTGLFRTVSDEIPIPDPKEVAGLEWLSLSDIHSRIKASPEKFTPPFRIALCWYIDSYV